MLICIFWRTFAAYMVYTHNWQSALLSLLEKRMFKQVLFVADSFFSARSFRLSYPVFTINADEVHKSIDTVQDIWSFLHDIDATRSTLLVAVGGGVVTDLAGFAAATYKRGIPYINIPTTLLAMVDASTGGKTGFNFRGVKNEIGCFYSPVETFIDVSFLSTLPREQLLSGFAEMLKTAVVADTVLLYELIDAFENTAIWSADCERLIQRAVEIKQAVVEADPRDTGLRHILNFGHTAGHAIEALSIEKGAVLPHGYAVMQGMVAAMYLSVLTQGLPSDILHLFSRLLLEYYGRPVCRCSDFDRLIELIRSDKKNHSALNPLFVLLRKAGEPVIGVEVSEAQIREALEYLYSL